MGKLPMPRIAAESILHPSQSRAIAFELFGTC